MKRYLTFIIIIISAFSCDDVIVKDISTQSVSVMSPPNQFNPSGTSVNFFWNFVEGAEEYQLEVVQGRFDNVLNFVLDTFVTSNQFTYNFQPGNYEWSLRALNSEYSTNYVVRSFIIDSVSDISQSIVVTTFPVNNMLYGDSSLTLRWQEVFSATQYFVELINKNNGSSVLKDTVNSTSINTGNILETNSYEWKLRALNGQSQTDFASVEFSVDLTVPGIPRLLLPANQLTPSVGPKVIFTWEPGHDNNWKYDSLYIHPNSLADPAVIAKKITDSTFIDSTTFINGQNYKWRVKSIDQVENAGSFSTTYDFTAQ